MVAPHQRRVARRPAVVQTVHHVDLDAVLLADRIQDSNLRALIVVHLAHVLLRHAGHDDRGRSVSPGLPYLRLRLLAQAAHDLAARLIDLLKAQVHFARLIDRVEGPAIVLKRAALVVTLKTGRVPAVDRRRIVYGLRARVLGRLRRLTGRLPHTLLLGLPHLLPRGLLAHLRVRRLLRQPLNACPRIGILRRIRAVPGDGLVLGNLRILLGLCGLLRGLGGLPRLLGLPVKLPLGNLIFYFRGYVINRAGALVDADCQSAVDKTTQRAAQTVHQRIAAHVQQRAPERFTVASAFFPVMVDQFGEFGFFSADDSIDQIRRLIDDRRNALFSEFGHGTAQRFLKRSPQRHLVGQHVGHSVKAHLLGGYFCNAFNGTQHKRLRVARIALLDLPRHIGKTG